MSNIEKILLQNPQIRQLMSKGADPRQMVIDLAKQGKIDVNQLIAMARRFGYTIPDNILQDINNSRPKGSSRF